MAKFKSKFTAHAGKQTEFLASTIENIFFGGARGGTKSFSLAWKGALQPRTYLYYDGKGNLITKEEAQLLKNAGQSVSIEVDKVSIDYPEYIGILILGEFHIIKGEPFSTTGIRLVNSIAAQASSAIQRAMAHTLLEDNYLQTVIARANAIDARDRYTGDRLRAVQREGADGRRQGVRLHSDHRRPHRGAVG